MPTVLEPRVAGEFPGGAQALRMSDAPGGDPRASPLGGRPERAVRPHHDWLLPCDITRLGEKCERERESEPQRQELQAKQGPPLDTPSPPPVYGPFAHLADLRGL